MQFPCPFGSGQYSEEELVAEMGAAFLCGVTGIDSLTIDNSAAYIEFWLHSLQNNPRLFLRAASHGQKAADYILGKSSDREKMAAPGRVVAAGERSA
jgi:antirestriction protein ArdC